MTEAFNELPNRIWSHMKIKTKEREGISAFDTPNIWELL